MENTYKHGDLVRYNLLSGNLVGEARVVGVATNGDLFLGKSYILEDLSENFPNVQHPYTHFVCFEVHMKSKGQI